MAHPYTYYITEMKEKESKGEEKKARDKNLLCRNSYHYNKQHCDLSDVNRKLVCLFVNENNCYYFKHTKQLGLITVY